MSKKPPKDENQEPFVFEGFEQSNTTPVPDVFFDVLLPLLSSSEVRVMLYIFRRTLGFKKSTDGISFNQFLGGITTKDGKVLDKGCGVKNRTALSQALANLETKWQCIESRKGDDPAGDKATTIYSVKFKVPGVVSKTYHMAIGGSIKNVPPVVSKTDYGSAKIVPQVVSNPYLQETVIQYTDSQETVIQESTSADSNIANPEIEDGTTVPLTPSPSFSLEVPRLTLPQRDMKQARMDEAEQGMIHMLLDPAIKADVFYLRDQKYTVSYFQDEGETFFLIKDPDTGKREPYNHSEFLHLVAKVRQDSAELSKRGIAHEVQNVLNEVFGEEKRFPSPPPLTPAIETTPLQASNSPIVDEAVNHTPTSGNGRISGSPSQIEAFSEEEVSGEQPAASSSTQEQAGGVSHSQGATGNDAPIETPEPEQPAGKGRRRNKKTNNPDFSPIPAPARPDADMDWTVEKCLAWGNYGRKCEFDPSNQPHSKYRKALEASRKIVGRGMTENRFLVLYFNWMKGVTLDLEPLPEGAVKSDTWPNYSVDLWVFVEHSEEEEKKYKQAKAAASRKTPSGNTEEKKSVITVADLKFQDISNYQPYRGSKLLRKKEVQ